MSLLTLIPEKKRPRAMLVAALELLCEASASVSNNGDLPKEEFHAMLEDILDDAVKEGIILSHRRILDRHELTKRMTRPKAWTRYAVLCDYVEKNPGCSREEAVQAIKASMRTPQNGLPNVCTPQHIAAATINNSLREGFVREDRDRRLWVSVE